MGVGVGVDVDVDGVGVGVGVGVGAGVDDDAQYILAVMLSIKTVWEEGDAGGVTGRQSEKTLFEMCCFHRGIA